ncbi:MAG: hypothetical protein IPP25_20935 [Saprospiraceae bacterium]|nr:hypothetical protein [Candidatus Opimibacter skivensis]
MTESNQYNVLIRDQYNCTYAPPAVFIEVFPKPEVIIKAREIYGPDAYGPWSSSLQICYGTEFEISASLPEMFLTIGQPESLHK